MAVVTGSELPDIERNILGMDVLTRRDWRMTFDESTWALAPR